MKSLLVRKMSIGAVALAAIVSLAAPTAANATAGGHTTASGVVTVTEGGSPAAGETVTVTASDARLLPGGSQFSENPSAPRYNAAVVERERAQSAAQAWYDARPTPIQDQVDAEAAAGNWTRVFQLNSARLAESRATEAAFKQTTIATEQTAALTEVSDARRAVVSAAEITLTGTTDQQGRVVFEGLGIDSGALVPTASVDGQSVTLSRSGSWTTVTGTITLP